ncbi:MAG: response regulator [Acidobacteriota bacterium]
MIPARILVVDDDEAIRLLVTRLFAREGHQVTTASDGEEASLRLTETPFDLVILDVMMPRMDGIHVARVIASGPEPRPQIIIMTAAVQSIIDELPHAHIWKVISKPFDLSQLLREGTAALAARE